VHVSWPVLHRRGVLPDNAETRRVLAAALAAAGRRTDAVAKYAEVLRIDPEDANVRRALDELEPS